MGIGNIILKLNSFADKTKGKFLYLIINLKTFHDETIQVNQFYLTTKCCTIKIYS